MRDADILTALIPSGPFEPELARLHLTPASAPWRTLLFTDFIDLLEGVFRSRPKVNLSADTEGWLRTVFGEYRSLNAQKALLRNELPLRVAYLAELGMNIGKGENFRTRNVIDKEIAVGASAAVQLRSSRHHEGALVFRGRQ